MFKKAFDKRAVILDAALRTFVKRGYSETKVAEITSEAGVAEGTLYNKAQILASVRDKSYHPDILQSTGMVVHAYGNTAVVTGAYYEKGVDKGKPWERRGRFTDTWIYLNGRWQCAASHFSVKPK